MTMMITKINLNNGLSGYALPLYAVRKDAHERLCATATIHQPWSSSPMPLCLRKCIFGVYLPNKSISKNAIGHYRKGPHVGVEHAHQIDNSIVIAVFSQNNTYTDNIIFASYGAQSPLIIVLICVMGQAITALPSKQNKPFCL